MILGRCIQGLVRSLSIRTAQLSTNIVLPWLEDTLELLRAAIKIYTMNIDIYRVNMKERVLTQRVRRR